MYYTCFVFGSGFFDTPTQTDYKLGDGVPPERNRTVKDSAYDLIAGVTLSNQRGIGQKRKKSRGCALKSPKP